MSIFGFVPGNMYTNRLYTLMSLILLTVILMPIAGDAQSDMFQYGQKEQSMSEMHQYCGRMLSSTLEIMCGSVYNPRFKKSNQEMEMDNYMGYSYDPHSYLKSYKDAVEMIKFRRNTRGVHEECCLKSCTTEELRSYCGAR